PRGPPGPAVPPLPRLVSRKLGRRFHGSLRAILPGGGGRDRRLEMEAGARGPASGGVGDGRTGDLVSWHGPLHAGRCEHPERPVAAAGVPEPLPGAQGNAIRRFDDSRGAPRVPGISVRLLPAGGPDLVEIHGTSVAARPEIPRGLDPGGVLDGALLPFRGRFTGGGR